MLTLRLNERDDRLLPEQLTAALTRVVGSEDLLFAEQARYETGGLAVIGARGYHPGVVRYETAPDGRVDGIVYEPRRPLYWSKRLFEEGEDRRIVDLMESLYRSARAASRGRSDAR